MEDRRGERRHGRTGNVCSGFGQERWISSTETNDKYKMTLIRMNPRTDPSASEGPASNQSGRGFSIFLG